MTSRTIKRLLVANRGEIADRIFRTASALGIETVAIYADGDQDAPFVCNADYAIALRGNTPTETYLDVEKVLNACELSQADALHPGYGFLSENCAFASAVQSSGYTWIGPPAPAIAQMGDKLKSKSTMQKVGIPLLEGVEVTLETDAIAVANELGFPVLVKASAGGGGRGMRVVERPQDLLEAIASAQRESQSAFGDSTVFLERWLAETRHIEVQILGDLHGNVVHLFERECSIQRRHQKIIEEAPSPAVSGTLRDRLGNAAVSAAKALDYSSAGTVEFLVSGEEFWFLEVNTRLQVEHPITEAVTGIDLVREQIRIAEGESLGYNQQELDISGHAIEARLYAEDPAKDFLPSSGTIKSWSPSPIARFDAGVKTGSTVNIEFDPMIAKVIAHGTNRATAIRKLTRALQATQIHGIENNRDFLVELLNTPEFGRGDTTTDFIERVAPMRKKQLSSEELHSVLTAVALYSSRRTSVSETPPQPRLRAQLPAHHHAFELNAHNYDVECKLASKQTYSVAIGEAHYIAKIVHVHDDFIDMEISNRRIRFDISYDRDKWFVHGPCGDLEVRSKPLYSITDRTQSSGHLGAPMPGKVLSINVEPKSPVEAGQLLLVLEAMKMEHRITAPQDGKISAIHVAVGDVVEKDVLLIELTADSTT